jgi:hypothetical protein
LQDRFVGTTDGSERFNPRETTKEKDMTLKYIALAAALAFAPAAFAQATGQQEPQIKPTQAGPGAAGETSDRTPEKAAQTPQNQQDTAGDKTSDRSHDKDAKVQHQPGAAGTAGASSSEGASTGEGGSAGDAGKPSAIPQASPNADGSSNTNIPAANPPASGAQ